MSSGCKVGAMSLAQSFEQFSAEHRAQGFDEVLKRHWPALTELATHEHEFQAKALVVDGEMWLSGGAQTHHLRAGSTFELDARLPHAERYGSEGATYWVARRHRPLDQQFIFCLKLVKGNHMSVDVKYRTTATATGGRDGQATLQDGSLSLKLATPKELGGAGGPGNNPEQLFAAGYAACFIGAMKAVAPAQKLRVPTDAKVTATVGLGPRAEGGFGITADLNVSLPGLDRADAQRLVEAAHQICPYSNATRGNVDVGLTLT